MDTCRDDVESKQSMSFYMLFTTSTSVLKRDVKKTFCIMTSLEDINSLT